MSIILQTNRVQVRCTCESWAPISRLYLCRYCLKFRCSLCAQHEVDTYFCSNCLDGVPVAEAKSRKYRCANCMDCPICGNTLSARTTTLLNPATGADGTKQRETAGVGEEESEAAGGEKEKEKEGGKGVTDSIASSSDASKPASNKVYYLVCTYCHWGSRDSAIPDQRQPSGGWKEFENPNSVKVAEVTESWKHVAARDRLEREHLRLALNARHRSGSSLLFHDRLGSSGPLLGISPAKALAGEKAQAGDSWSEEYEEVEPLSVELNNALVLETVSTLSQRLRCPTLPDEKSLKATGLTPLNHSYMSKLSLRCRECEHNLSKGESSVASIKFKIQLCAFYQVPEIRITQISKEKQTPTSVILTVINPSPRPVTIQLVSLTLAEAKHLCSQTQSPTAELEWERESSRNVSSSGTGTGTSVSAAEGAEQAGSAQNPRAITVTVAAQAPEGQVEEGTSASEPPDDKRLIAYRRANRVGIRARVNIDSRTTTSASNPATLGAGKSALAVPVRVLIRLEHQYRNTLASLQLPASASASPSQGVPQTPSSAPSKEREAAANALPEYVPLSHWLILDLGTAAPPASTLAPQPPALRSK